MAVRNAVPPSLRQVAKAITATRGHAVQLRRVFDQSLIPMIMVDNDRRYIEVNAAARLLARISLEEIRLLRIDDLTAEEDMPVLSAAWAELIEQGSVSGRYPATFTDGGSISVHYAGIANVLPGRHIFAFVPADWPGEELEAIHVAVDQEAASPLSNRQLDVLRLVAVGANASEMAAELSISEATIRTHVKNILERLGAHNRAHAVALAMKQGLLDGTGRSISGSNQGL